VHVSVCNAVRLVGSGVPWEGRLEVYIRGEWGTVSYRTYHSGHRTFDNRKASIVCQMLGYQ